MNRSPVMKSRLILDRPMRLTMYVDITDGIIPRFVSLNANFSPGGAIVMSHTATSPIPPPNA